MTNEQKPVVVLTVAGFDPSGGAGVLADIKTIAAFGCYGVAAVSGITFQNTLGVSGVLSESAKTIRQQIAPLFDDFEIAAVKTGMLPTAEVVQEVASLIRQRAIPVVVVDPVIRSTSGFELVERAAIDSLVTHLFPLASLITPNRLEAELISRVPIQNRLQAERAGETILRKGARAVLITGGDTESSLDLLVDKDGSIAFNAEHVQSQNTHGTGCSFASALACLMAQGRAPKEAIPIAKDYVQRAILSAPGLGHGQGPLNHFPPGFKPDPK
ncbi:MAG TPA: bifunctional hydroxymethylpyrimidine kinase/phosphomethylpyrimidine kinase [Blastocatellia bacterium]|nr:bifunctional hydroxymethylpyrimidine kinase/phosphomethylpyrimidine kinase [Blastocatellia bacterium]